MKKKVYILVEVDKGKWKEFSSMDEAIDYLRKAEEILHGYEPTISLKVEE